MAKKVLVVIDPGHVGPTYNAGAMKGYYESAAVWKLSKYEKDELEKYGIKVIITKKTISDDIELYDRGQVAVKNAKGYDAVVFESNHTNAANGKACGVSIIRSAHLPGSGALGKIIGDAIVGVMRPVTKITYNRGVTIKKQSNGSDWYGVIRGAVSGARSEAAAKKGPVQYDFIVEHGFHDNLTECKFLYNDANLKKIAAAKAKAIAGYFGLKAGGSTSSRTIYRVRKIWADAKGQKGAFENLANAKACADKYPGYSVYDEAGRAVYTSKSPEAINRKAKFTEGLQLALNASYNAGLDIDRSAGPLTQGVIDDHYLRYKLPTIKNAHVSWLQDAYNELGYDVDVDGSFGPAMEKATEQFQRDHGLVVDGKAGVKTHLKVLSLL